MAVIVSPVYQSFNNGAVNSGGSLYVYQTGTTTLVNLYSNAALTQPITNPCTLDINGQVVFYVSTSTNLRIDSYTQAGSFIETIDPVYLSGGSSSSSSTSSGGYVNKFRNPGFDVQQRGATGSITAGTPAYSFDGWIISSTGANVAYSTNGTAYTGVFTSANSINIQGASGVTDTYIKQRIESLIAASLANQTCTVQFWLYNETGAPITPTLTVKHASSVDSWGSPVTDVNAVSLQTVPILQWSPVAYTFNAAINSFYGLEITLDFGGVLNSSGADIIIAGADIRVTNGLPIGQTATASIPVPEIRPIAQELAFCQRYFVSFGSILETISLGIGTGTTSMNCLIKHPVTMRTGPTSVAITTAADLEITSAAGSNLAAVTSISIGPGGLNGTFVQVNVASGLTSGTPYYLQANTALAGNLKLIGAEL